MTGTHPYAELPDEAFWRLAVAEPGILGLKDLWRSKWQLPADCRMTTYGSCFAQHISNALKARGLNWVDREPGPRPMAEELRSLYNYGIYSSRTGNIYTAKQLLIWAQLAFDGATDAPEPEYWEKDGQFWDSLRPAIEPKGFASLDEARANRAETTRCFRPSIAQTDLLIFTLGLTEGWENRETGQPYAICPGTAAGTFDATRHVFRNYGFAETKNCLEGAFGLFRKRNPDLKIILTVSPIPITATASGNHVLSASTYTKSVLRAVAGELAADLDFVDYFPSYELLASHPARGMYYKSNLRNVAQPGVDFAVSSFLDLIDLSGPAQDPDTVTAPAPAQGEGLSSEADIKCEEEILELYSHAKT